MNKESFDGSSWPREADFVAERRLQEDRLYLLDLIRVLKPHAAGLRRWSVMRKIRAYREAAGFPSGHRMEDTIERLFRNHCADAAKFKRRERRRTPRCFSGPRGNSEAFGPCTPIAPRPG